MLNVLLAFIGLLLFFVWWRWTSVVRGARQRDAIILARLDPLGARFDARTPVDPREIARLAESPENRRLLYQLLKHFNRTDLFPPALLTPSAQGEGILAYWLMHPNEAKAAPAAIEHLETVPARALGGLGDYYVYRYRMAPGHWAGTDWFLGLAGPFFPDEEPYLGSAGGFARGRDRQGSTTPRSLVDWYAQMIDSKVAKG